MLLVVLPLRVGLSKDLFWEENRRLGTQNKNSNKLTGRQILVR